MPTETSSCPEEWQKVKLKQVIADSGTSSAKNTDFAVKTSSLSDTGVPEFVGFKLKPISKPTDYAREDGRAKDESSAI